MTRPRLTCLMAGSLDGRLHSSRWTESPDGSAADWTGAYETLHDRYDADGWIVGRVTMAEMAKGEPHPPAEAATPTRPLHVARDRGPYAIALDPGGKLHFVAGELHGDHVVVLLGAAVPDSHLAELAGDGVSYIVCADHDGGLDLAAALDVLGKRFGARHLLLEGGGGVNGGFLAAGLVEQFDLVLAPALDGGASRAIVEAGDAGLKGKVQLKLIGVDQLGHGALHLRYAVTSAQEAV
ncbi:dihydrofolate reductase family protein [Sphingomonas yunnanensis]|uniref:dihydrofolate reductase family protein n=1 Tax=Sphingomonas yunnanensis TaxID=310400 RepID=UPI001CA668BD|nr:dihydrofolate reductase family protein [Sphingomonas yunnanensis]MBY9062419.1 dihydrofolate reductase family protein [Sphingomonas yunnanensis]